MGNHNLSALAAGALPAGWASASPSTAIDGTSQKEENWMGSFDGFVFPTGGSSTTLTEVSANLAGFMPKTVRGFPLGGVNQSMSQFEVAFNITQLRYSSNSAPPYVEVPYSNPRDAAMS